MLLTLWGGQASAQTLFERLVMPGDLTASHAKLQADCSNCHESFRQGAQVSLCLDCHEETALNVEQRTGFHGRAPEALALNCSHCHTDHEGRDFDIVQFNPEVFDHGMSDFALTGVHNNLPCVACHAEGKSFREAPEKCVDCHRHDDPHNGELGPDCAQCHSSDNWGDVAAFDHSRTDFSLEGQHREVACTTCHIGEIYKGVPTSCVGCHTIQDVHQDRFGPKCETCHTPSDWTEVHFEHDQDTDFVLTGAHRTAECNACHQGNIETHPAEPDCISCHDDVHDGQLGSTCESCHSTNSWHQDVVFDHDITMFPLIGLHVLAPCEQCHLDAAFLDADTDCTSCHAAEDVHEGSLGEACNNCHTPNGWAFWSFDHNNETDFMLTGKHNGLVCEACHVPGKPPDQTETSCAVCHADVDVHKGAFGADCSACHSTEDFKNARLQ